MQWATFVRPALRVLRQEGLRFPASLKTKQQHNRNIEQKDKREEGKELRKRKRLGGRNRMRTKYAWRIEVVLLRTGSK